MLYYFLDWLNYLYDIPGFGVFKYLSFRAILSMVFSLIISILIGNWIISLLRKNLIGEVVRDTTIGPDHASKAGTPTMGGIIIIAAIIIPTLLWADLQNGYVILILIGTVWMGIIGFIDDYIKVFMKDKRGLKGKFKLVGQIVLGLVVGLTMIFHPDFMGSRAHITQLNIIDPNPSLIEEGFRNGDELVYINGEAFDEFPIGDDYETVESYTIRREAGGKTKDSLIVIDQERRKHIANQIFGPKDISFIYITDFPFFKDYVFDYSKLFFLDRIFPAPIVGRIIYILMVILIVTAVSNSVNLTDGIDGLAAGTTAIVGVALGVFAYVSGNIVFSDYLNISYIPLSSELIIYGTALVGACLGFLWYNAFPAQVFMGDTGSLALGGAVGVMALMVKKELLLPILCGIYFAESLSVIIQVSYFKYTKRKYGEGRRIFRMAPLHHHYEKIGMHEAKIVARFLLVAILLVLLAFATLKLR